MSDGIIGLVAHVRAGSGQVGPVIQSLKAMNKHLQDSSWRPANLDLHLLIELSGSGKMQNVSLKDHVARQDPVGSI